MSDCLFIFDQKRTPSLDMSKMFFKEDSELGFQKEFILPGELRNQIYEQLFIFWGREPKFFRFRAYPPPIIQVCQALRAETVSTYYRDVTLDLDSWFPSDAMQRQHIEHRRAFGYRWGRRGYHENLLRSDNSPIGVLSKCIDQIGVAQFKLVSTVRLRIRDYLGHRSAHELDLYIRLEGGNLATASITIDSRRADRRWERVPLDKKTGQFGRVVESSGTGLGCATFNHYIYRYLKSEDERNDKEENDDSKECRNDNKAHRLETDNDEYRGGEPGRDGEEHETDGHEGQYVKYKLGEIDPPAWFHPKTDISTVLTILDAAFQYHSCDHMREPATASPCRSNAPLSDPRLSINRPSRTSFQDENLRHVTMATYPEYCDDVNRGLDTKNHNIAEAEERGHLLSGHVSRFEDATLLERAEPYDVRWKGPVAAEIHSIWEKKRRAAGLEVKDMWELVNDPRRP